jgi:iron-sulfur cluster repair protein YtfE (RIC family)
MPELIMYAYCGMKVPIMKGDMATCHAKAKKMRERHERYGGAVTVLAPTKWELETPETACMVSDEDGILAIKGEDDDESVDY